MKSISNCGWFGGGNDELFLHELVVLFQLVTET